MAREARREVTAFLWHVLMVLVALVVAFFWEMVPVGGEKVNLSEAWENLDPYVWKVVSVFIVLGGLRLAGIYAINRLTGKSPD